MSKSYSTVSTRIDDSTKAAQDHGAVAGGDLNQGINLSGRDGLTFNMLDAESVKTALELSRVALERNSETVDQVLNLAGQFGGQQSTTAQRAVDAVTARELTGQGDDWGKYIPLFLGTVALLGGAWFVFAGPGRSA